MLHGAQIFGYNPGPRKVKCNQGYLGYSTSGTQASTCASSLATVKPSDTARFFDQWRMTPVPGQPKTYTISASKRANGCRRFLAVRSACSAKPLSLGLVAADTKAARWVLETYRSGRSGRSAAPAGGAFVAPDPRSGRPTLVAGLPA